VIAAACFGGYIVLDTYAWPDQTPKEQVALDPDTAYAASRDQALASRSTWIASNVVPSVMRQANREVVSQVGWRVSSIGCAMPKGLGAAGGESKFDVTCTLTWVPETGAMDELKKVVPDVVFVQKSGQVSGQVTHTYKLDGKAAVLDTAKLLDGQQVLVATGSAFKRLNDGGIVTAGLKDTVLLGVIPTAAGQGRHNTPLALKKPAMAVGDWTMSGPLGFTSAASTLPDNFALSGLTINFGGASGPGSADSFELTGNYFTRQ